MFKSFSQTLVNIGLWHILHLKMRMKLFVKYILKNMLVGEVLCNVHVSFNSYTRGFMWCSMSVSLILVPCNVLSLFLHLMLYLCFITLCCITLYIVTWYQRLQIIDPSQALKEMGVEEHHLRFTSTISIEEEGPSNKVAEKIYQLVKR